MTSSIPHIKRGVVAALAAGLAALGAPAAAQAGTVSIGSDHVLRYSAGPSESNHLSLSFDWTHGVYVVKDTGIPSIPAPVGNSCSSFDAHTVYCPFGSFHSISVQLGSGPTAYAEDDLSLTAVTMIAGGGTDTLIGGGGPTTLVGGSGQDTLTAGSGDTTFVGGSGPTTMNGSTGHDTFQGGAGSDTINARDGIAEQVSCGGGIDWVVADVSDTVAADCEHVDRGVATAGGSGAAPAPAPAPLPGDLPGAPAGFQVPTASVTAPAAPVSVDAAGNVPVTLDCPATAVGGCQGTVALSLPSGTTVGRVEAARRERQTTIGRSGKFAIQPGHRKVVLVKLSRRGARMLTMRNGRTRRVLRVTATVAMRTEAGTASSSRVITVTAARRRPMPVHRPKPVKRRA